jgi:hypothetical protein
VIVAMIAVRMVEMPIDQVIHVIAMRHGLMSTSWTVYMARLVTAAAMIWRAMVWILCAHFDHMLIDMIVMGMMEMAVMQIVDVVAMTNGSMAAARAMLMIVISMMRKIAGSHDLSLSGLWSSEACSTAFLIRFRTWLSAIE